MPGLRLWRIKEPESGLDYTAPVQSRHSGRNNGGRRGTGLPAVLFG